MESGRQKRGYQDEDVGCSFRAEKLVQQEDTWARLIPDRVLAVPLQVEDMCWVRRDTSQILVVGEMIHSLSAYPALPPSGPALRYIRCQTYGRLA